jgi:O-acetyl-ADP-ribose deacetylase (regulator of RNase III)
LRVKAQAQRLFKEIFLFMNTLKMINETAIELQKGDITAQNDIEAIVNAANSKLITGGGVAGAIHSKGDPELSKETRKFAPIEPGEAVLTSAPNLPNSYIIHCLGPVYGVDSPSDELLESCYKNALRIANENRIQSIAFPAISTGAFGYPTEEAAKVAFTCFKEIVSTYLYVKRIRMVLWSDRDYEDHSKVFREIFG